MKNVSKAEVIKTITGAVKEYDKKLANRDFLIAYKENQEIKFSCVGFRKHNFKHLTGVDTKLPSNVFYNKCIDGKLSPKDFEIDNKGKVAQKMVVLPYLGEVLYKNCMIGQLINSGIAIRADYFVGGTRVYICVGIRNSETNVDFPVSLYNEDIRKITAPSCRVLAIFAKEAKNRTYTECTFLAKNVELNKIKIPSEYSVSVMNNEIARTGGFKETGTHS